MSNPTASEIMTAGRFFMMQKFPFFAYLLFNLEVIELGEDNNPWKLQTAAVDGKHFWYNPSFIQEIYQEGLKESKEIANHKVAFLCAHEVMHCALGHLGRRIDRDPDIWDQAADYAINGMLVEAKLTMPKIGLYDKKYSGWSAEMIYDDLLKNPEKTKGKSTMDVHAGQPGFPGDGDGKGGQGGDQDPAGGGDPADSLTPEQLQDLKDQWEENMVQAAQNCKDAGNIPAGFERLIKKITEPKVRWNEYIETVIKSLIRSDYTWRIPNKRVFANGITMPSLDYDDSVEIGIAIDMSGSISDEEAAVFLGEIKSIMGQFTNFKIHIACFDSALHAPATLESEEDLDNYQPKGGGGTTPMAWWNWAMKQDWYDTVGTVIMFTDGYIGGPEHWGPGEEKSPNTIWLVKGSDYEGPYGTTILYEKL